MQSVDYTTLVALCGELQDCWLPARVEQVYQSDRHTLALSLRTLEKRGWLALCWHPQAARLCLADPPPTIPDTFTLSEQLRHQLKGLALVAVVLPTSWERVVNLQFAPRPGDRPQLHLFGEIMGKYSNLILTDAQQQIITVAHQVNAQQSRVRTVQTGQPYLPPPAVLAQAPKLSEPWQTWQERVSLIPGELGPQLLKTYQGLSPRLVKTLLQGAHLQTQTLTTSLTTSDWQNLFQVWQCWLLALEQGNFTPHWTAEGYSVFSPTPPDPQTLAPSVHSLINRYYGDHQQQEKFQHLHQQLQQKVRSHQDKLQHKNQIFHARLQEATEAESQKQRADLLMAHLHLAQPGLSQLTLPDFETQKPVTIHLRPDRTLLQNAQSFYKQHQKLKRVQDKVVPLLEELRAEGDYLQTVAASLNQLEGDRPSEDLEALTEIREELIEQGYLTNPQPRRRLKPSPFHPCIFLSPSDFEIWIGRNNRQNDYLTFRVAREYDLWFHSQEIPGSHVLLRLSAGAIAEAADLQSAADLSAYFSQARQSEQVPVVYTQPKYVFKPKGARPGMVVYQKETILWGKPANLPLYRRKNYSGVG